MNRLECNTERSILCAVQSCTSSCSTPPRIPAMMLSYAFPFAACATYLDPFSLRRLCKAKPQPRKADNARRQYRLPTAPPPTPRARPFSADPFSAGALSCGAPEGKSQRLGVFRFGLAEAILPLAGAGHKTIHPMCFSEATAAFQCVRKWVYSRGAVLHLHRGDVTRPN